MPNRYHQFCILMLIADGFEEAETITWLTAFRQAGYCTKCISLTSGPVTGAHGVGLKPDLVLADIDQLIETTSIKLIILPENGQSLALLQVDARVHRLLRQVVARGGQVVVGPKGRFVLQAAGVWSTIPADQDSVLTSVVERDPAQTPAVAIQDLIHKLSLIA